MRPKRNPLILFGAALLGCAIHAYGSDISGTISTTLKPLTSDYTLASLTVQLQSGGAASHAIAGSAFRHYPI